MSVSHSGFKKEWRRETARIVSGQTVDEGDLLAWVDGEVRRYANTSGYVPAGICDGPAEKNAIATGGATGDMSDPGVYFRHSVVIKDVAVTGVASEANVGDLVYATDYETFNISRPAADATPVGHVHWKKNGTTTTTCDVYIYGKRDALLAAGKSKERLFLGTVHTTALEGTSALDLLKMTMYGRGKIVKLLAFPNGFDAGYTGGSQTFTLEIGSTNTTGGVLTLASTSCDASGDMGTQIDATAITADNEYSDGDILTLELVASGTGFTAAIDTVSFNIYIEVENLPGN
jgi:hypothetical protein